MRTVGSGLLAACALALLPWVPTASADAGWSVRTVRAANGYQISTIGLASNPPSYYDALDLLSGKVPSQADHTTGFSVINFQLPMYPSYPYGDHFNSSNGYPNNAYDTIPASADPRGYTTAEASKNNFAVDSIGYVQVTSPATYTFDVNSDDGFRFLVQNTGNNAYLSSSPYPNMAMESYDRTNSDTFLTYSFVPGLYKLDLTYFQDGGYGNLELSAAPGTYGTSSGQTTPYNSDGSLKSAFQLVGAPGGIQVTSAPEPSSICLLGLTGVALLKRRRTR